MEITKDPIRISVSLMRVLNFINQHYFAILFIIDSSFSIIGKPLYAIFICLFSFDH
jgi:hypothetical protein